MNGVVQGGWEFVIAAYAVTGLGFAFYTFTLFARLFIGYLRSRKHD